ncbi:unnamed protein product [Amoebophrya sp. A25]|nr:unnamed protein product [Amoebophrya sp. A25]|eukprot:GSA25T00023647001.1
MFNIIPRIDFDNMLDLRKKSDIMFFSKKNFVKCQTSNENS